MVGTRDDFLGLWVMVSIGLVLVLPLAGEMPHPLWAYTCLPVALAVGACGGLVNWQLQRLLNPAGRGAVTAIIIAAVGLAVLTILLSHRWYGQDPIRQVYAMVDRLLHGPKDLRP